MSEKSCSHLIFDSCDRVDGNRPPLKIVDEAFVFLRWKHAGEICLRRGERSIVVAEEERLQTNYGLHRAAARAVSSNSYELRT